jgi:hypothetical protein
MAGLSVSPTLHPGSGSSGKSGVAAADTFTQRSLTSIKRRQQWSTRLNQGIWFARSTAQQEEAMFNRTVTLILGALFVATSAYAQGTLLIEPSQAPMTLKGGWEKKQGPAGHSGNRGNIAVKISKINPDGSFEGKLDFTSTGSQPWCRAADEPIQQGQITDNGIKVVANGGPATTCGLMTLEFRRGTEKYLQGRVKSEAGGGSPMWLDAPR